ncbi:MAG TPA: glycosyltransferase [Candidatus Binataceae bacterium]|nr:glycosyltransferase [Candidatus Binataceae bacterium]
MTIKISIAIPTHNRSDLVGDTLAGVFATRIPEGCQVECVVIDNASTDATAAIVDAAARNAPFPARRVVELRLGSSFARNRAIDETSGDVILFVDDDAIASEDWAVQLIDEVGRRSLDVACGMVIPKWEIAPPAWLKPPLWSKLAVHDQDSILRSPAGAEENLANYFSANFAIRRSAFERFGRFREDLGVVGGNPISGEDTELFARIIAGGGKIGFARRAVIQHRIGPERMTREYLRRKSFAFGVGSAIAAGKSHNRLDKLLKNVFRMASAWTRGDATAVVYHQMECANFFGYWWGRVVVRRRMRGAIG